MEQIKVQVIFTIGEYTDALYYTLDEWDSMTHEQVEADKQARYGNWLAVKEQMEQDNLPVEEQ